MLQIQYDKKSNFCLLICPTHTKFSNAIRFGITPTSYRRFNSAQRKWEVHLKKISYVISIGFLYFKGVDLGNLPPDVKHQFRHLMKEQKKILQKQKSEKQRSMETLFLMPDAPLEVIQASYRALCLKHHPDRGGDSEKFIEIQQAYEFLKKSLEA